MRTVRILIAATLVLALISPVEARRRLPWCGIYLAHYFGKHDRKLWAARNWKYEGRDAGGPAVGVVVVWAHHVGVIVGRDAAGAWLVHSGNDGGRVRTRPRALDRAIAFRWIFKAGT